MFYCGCYFDVGSNDCFGFYYVNFYVYWLGFVRDVCV